VALAEQGQSAQRAHAAEGGDETRVLAIGERVEQPDPHGPRKRENATVIGRTNPRGVPLHLAMGYASGPTLPNVDSPSTINRGWEVIPAERRRRTLLDEAQEVSRGLAGPACGRDRPRPRRAAVCQAQAETGRRGQAERDECRAPGALEPQRIQCAARQVGEGHAPPCAGTACALARSRSRKVGVKSVL